MASGFSFYKNKPGERILFGVKCSRYWAPISNIHPPKRAPKLFPKGPKTIPDQLHFATGLPGAAEQNQECFSKHTNPTPAGCKVAKPRSQKLRATTDSKLASSSYCQNSSRARAGRNLPAPAGLHLPPRTRRFKKPPLEFNPKQIPTREQHNREGRSPGENRK